MKVSVEPEVGCWCHLDKEEIPDGEGPFIDLKSEPERSNELPEVKEWPALWDFIMKINLLPALRTAGCKASGHTPGGLNHPFVDVALADDRLALHEELNVYLRTSFERLQHVVFEDDFRLAVWGSRSHLPGDREVETMRIWLCAERNTSESAFPILLGFLASIDEQFCRAVAEAPEEAP